jgi:hypothetical protein
MLAFADGATADHRTVSGRRTGMFHEGYGGLSCSLHKIRRLR